MKITSLRDIDTRKSNLILSNEKKQGAVKQRDPTKEMSSKPFKQ